MATGGSRSGQRRGFRKESSERGWGPCCCGGGGKEGCLFNAGTHGSLGRHAGGVPRALLPRGAAQGVARGEGYGLAGARLLEGGRGARGGHPAAGACGQRSAATAPAQRSGRVWHGQAVHVSARGPHGRLRQQYAWSARNPLAPADGAARSALGADHEVGLAPLRDPGAAEAAGSRRRGCQTRRPLRPELRRRRIQRKLSELRGPGRQGLLPCSEPWPRASRGQPACQPRRGLPPQRGGPGPRQRPRPARPLRPGVAAPQPGGRHQSACGGGP
mmetsp:Transcript_73502/g.192782  ORF Transcript_73502/g.192782 Transcript_73502/m.192782 type:complete len:273 (+) Transcript_73502:606-1424(+)